MNRYSVNRFTREYLVDFCLEKYKSFIMTALITALSITVIICLSFAVNAPAKSSAANSQELGLVSVQVQPGDTLWSIAEDNYDPSFGSMDDYIDQIRETNSLGSDMIYPGVCLAVPVYR
ncbi:MAG: LysM peptidoglycan-binding domain-containing protein [Lachnospiraceae bacterium]|jgi:hypothetical protein|nr:LysM peptidoglycan-binding domain-containing protein [Lachnospiraceae bacterium]